MLVRQCQVMYFGKGHSNGSVGAQIDWKSLSKMLMQQMVNIFKKKKKSQNLKFPYFQVLCKGKNVSWICSAANDV